MSLASSEGGSTERGSARSAPIVQRTSAGTRSSRLAGLLLRERCRADGEIARARRAAARAARASSRRDRAEERPLVGPRLQRLRIEEDARAGGAAAALQRQRDQVAEPLLRQEVLVREEPVVAREVDLGPAWSSPRAAATLPAAAPNRQRPAPRRRSRRGRPRRSGCAPARPAPRAQRTPRAGRARRAATSCRRSRRRETSSVSSSSSG